MAEPEAPRGVIVSIVGRFLEGRQSLLFLIFAFCLGAAALLLTPKEEEPQIIVPMADIFVQAPGASAEEVEKLAATPLERLLWQIDGVEYVYSTSRRDSAVVTVRFYVGENREDSLVKLHNTIMNNTDLVPAIVKGWVVKPVEIDDVPIVTLALYSDQYDDHALRRMGEELFHRLAELEDISRLAVVGGPLPGGAGGTEPGAHGRTLGFAPGDRGRLAGRGHLRHRRGPRRAQPGNAHHGGLLPALGRGSRGLGHRGLRRAARLSPGRGPSPGYSRGGRLLLPYRLFRTPLGGNGGGGRKNRPARLLSGGNPGPGQEKGHQRRTRGRTSPGAGGHAETNRAAPRRAGGGDPQLRPNRRHQGQRTHRGPGAGHHHRGGRAPFHHGLAGGPHRGPVRARELRPGPVREPSAGLHHQPRHPVRPHPLPGTGGGRSHHQRGQYPAPHPHGQAQGPRRHSLRGA